MLTKIFNVVFSLVVHFCYCPITGSAFLGSGTAVCPREPSKTLKQRN